MQLKYSKFEHQYISSICIWTLIYIQDTFEHQYMPYAIFSLGYFNFFNSSNSVIHSYLYSALSSISNLMLNAMLVYYQNVIHSNKKHFFIKIWNSRVRGSFMHNILSTLNKYTYIRTKKFNILKHILTYPLRKNMFL